MAYKALTIIIPTYNVSNYIEKCLDSVTKNTDILDYLEIIVINDGSTDDSGKKAQVYADRYPQSVILVNKENGGHGSALNVGIGMATGEYLRILDSDDWINCKGLENQVQFIKEQEEKVDLIINPYEEVWESGKHRIKTVDYPELIKYGDSFDLKVLANHGCIPFIWNATYKTKLYRVNNIPQIDEGISFDDIEFSIFIMPFLKTVKYLPDIVYHYRLGRTGQSVNPTNKIRKQWMHEKIIDRGYKYRLVGGPAQELIDARLVKEIGSDFHTYLLWDDKKEAKRKFMEVVHKYNDLPYNKSSNKKMRLVFRSKFIGFGVIGMFYRIKNKFDWK